MGPSLGILEVGLIARGVVVADAVVKRAEVELLGSRPVSSGKHLILFAGAVAEVGEGFAAGRAAAGDALVDQLLLAHLHEPLWPLLGAPVHATEWAGEARASAAVIETRTVCAAIAAADAACKAAQVIVRDLHLAVGIAGKAFFSLTGELHDVEAAVAAARAEAGDRLLTAEIIPAPAAELVGRLIF